MINKTVTYSCIPSGKEEEPGTPTTETTVRFFGVLIYKKLILHPKTVRLQEFHYPQ